MNTINQCSLKILDECLAVYFCDRDVPGLRTKLDELGVDPDSDLGLAFTKFVIHRVKLLDEEIGPNDDEPEGAA